MTANTPWFEGFEVRRFEFGGGAVYARVGGGHEILRDVHVWLAQALIAAAAVHLAGVATMGWRWRESLVVSISTGKERAL